MAWPTPQDYNEAVQNPKLAFADPELQLGCPELTPLGLPRAITGGFASVYRLQCPQHTWAVRCFLRQFHDHEQRYAAISQHLTRVRLPYTVGFTFLRDGIRVRGQWYPILKMEWVQGESLSTFIERHLGNRSDLLSLARRWVEMVKALQQASIAHGDLQHGNVLVVDGQLRLVDYDGMYVPALAGKSSLERGHRNYQHPHRTESDFGPYLDNFSAWVVYVSLVALAADPGLWRQFGGGDECLLFRETDFKQPEASDVLRTLERHRDEQIRSAVKLFKCLLYFSPRDVPSLDEQVAPPGFSSIQVSRFSSSWIDDHVKRGGAGAPVSVVPESATLSSPDPSWTLEFAAPNPSAGAKVAFKNSPTLERLVVTVSAAIIAAFTIWMPPLSLNGAVLWLLGILLPIMQVNLALWIWRYRSDPRVREWPQLMARLKATRDRISATEHALELANWEKTELQSIKEDRKAKLEEEWITAEANKQREIHGCQTALQSALASINARRQALSQQKADALRKIQNDIQAQVAKLNQQIAKLDQDEANELANTLQSQQERYIHAFLSRFPIRHARLPGYPPAELISRLERQGFRTAADINSSVQRVRGIGPKRYATLIRWRQDLESKAQLTMPTALSQSELKAIQNKYRSQRQALEEQRGREQGRLNNEEKEIEVQYWLSLQRLDEEEKQIRANTQAKIDKIEACYDQRRQAIDKALAQLSADTAVKLREVDARIAESRKKLFSLYWEKEKIMLELKGYHEEIRFLKYVKRIFYGSKVS